MASRTALQQESANSLVATGSQSPLGPRLRSAMSAADELISSLLVARSYPKGSFDQRAADISVSYLYLMEDYRLANGIAVRPGRVDASTEELRTAMIQYRTIFDELVPAQKPQGKRSAA
jgi:hypothetical protein